MRQANFPDQKALTARDETNSEPSQWSPAGSVNSGYHAVQLQQPKDKGNTEQETLPLLYHLRTLRYWPPSSLLWSSMWKAVQFIWSCHLPMQSCHVDDPDLYVFLRATCQISMRPSWSYTSWLAPCQDGHQQCPFLTGHYSFPWLTLESSWQGKRNLTFPLLDFFGRMRECAGSKASSLQKPLSPLQCDAGLHRPDSCALIFSPFLGFLNFSVHFLKWQVSYPTLNKIK